MSVGHCEAWRSLGPPVALHCISGETNRLWCKYSQKERAARIPRPVGKKWAQGCSLVVSSASRILWPNWGPACPLSLLSRKTWISVTSISVCLQQTGCPRCPG